MEKTIDRAEFKTTNPSDNPVDSDGKTARQRELDAAKAGKVQDPADRPYGITGVDKSHGGGTTGLEQMTQDRAGISNERLPRGNPNNPNDPGNLASTANRDLDAQKKQVRSDPVTTVQQPTINEQRQADRDKAKADAEAKERERLKGPYRG